ncbi:MAG TPA: hypothetical protein VLD37_05365 [Candidatus Bilamarchaeum sp.]|nr:hypothetical protein [Candidatus Bilamarchaeum sp.]
MRPAGGLWPRGGKKGQASLEYLLLGMVGLALLSFSIYSLSGIKSSMDENLAVSRFRDSATGLHNAISEVCAMGGGNSREVLLSSPLSVETSDSESGLLAAYSYGNLSIVRETYCEIAPAKTEGKVIVENKDGKIRLR